MLSTLTRNKRLEFRTIELRTVVADPSVNDVISGNIFFQVLDNTLFELVS